MSLIPSRCNVLVAAQVNSRMYDMCVLPSSLLVTGLANSRSVTANGCAADTVPPGSGVTGSVVFLLFILLQTKQQRKTFFAACRARMIQRVSRNCFKMSRHPVCSNCQCVWWIKSSAKWCVAGNTTGCTVSKLGSEYCSRPLSRSSPWSVRHPHCATLMKCWNVNFTLSGWVPHQMLPSALLTITHKRQHPGCDSQQAVNLTKLFNRHHRLWVICWDIAHH